MERSFEELKKALLQVVAIQEGILRDVLTSTFISKMNSFLVTQEGCLALIILLILLSSFLWSGYNLLFKK